jgi:two-component system, chemotaxis family, protein-glutamate methylesterase/glutaminase
MPQRRNPPIQVVIVDDSTLMRTALRHILEADDDISVIGEARNGREAVEMVGRLQPDVVTMDLEMPDTDGITAIRAITSQYGPRIAIIVVSQHSQPDCEATTSALAAGALDFVSKSSSMLQFDLDGIDRDLLPKIHQWGKLAKSAPRVLLRPRNTPQRLPPSTVRPPHEAGGEVDLVVIGVSTGGPATLHKVLGAMGPVGVPVVVAQHMPALYTKSLAESLSRDLNQIVVEGVFDQAVPPGTVTILPGGFDARLARSRGKLILKRVEGEGTLHPSADILFQSAAREARHPVAIILSGMGRDGTLGAQAMRQGAHRVLVQRPDTAVVPGMPSAAIEAGHATHILGLEEIGAIVARWTRRAQEKEAKS